MFHLFKRRKETPLSDVDSIKSHLARLFITNYYSVQSTIFDTLDVKDFFDERTEAAAKFCVEYSVLLFEITVLMLAASDKHKNLPHEDFYNHFYRAHIVCTQDAAMRLSISFEDKKKHFTDDSHFDSAISYYHETREQKDTTIHFATLHPFKETSLFKSFCNDMFDAFSNRLIYFLFTDNYRIAPNAPLPLISKTELASITRAINFFAGFCEDYIVEGSKILGID